MLPSSSLIATVLAGAFLAKARKTSACSPMPGWRQATHQEEWSAAASVVSGDVVATVDCSYDVDEVVVFIDPAGAGDEVGLVELCEDVEGWGPRKFALVRNLSWNKGEEIGCDQLIISGFTSGAECGLDLPHNFDDQRFFLCDVGVDPRNVGSGTCTAIMNGRGDIHVGYGPAFKDDDIAKGNVVPTCPQDGTCQSLTTCKIGDPEHVPYEGSVDTPEQTSTATSNAGAGKKNLPPKKCKFTKKMFVEGAPLHQNEALCSERDGGWKYGINNKGDFGLWNEDGDVVEIYDTGADWMEVYEDDDDVAIWVWGEDGDLSWEMYCGSNQQHEAGKVRLRINGNVENVVKLTATNPPLDNLMRIKKNGKIKLNKKFCTVRKFR